MSSTCVGHKLTPRRHFPLSSPDNGIVSEIMGSTSLALLTPVYTRTFVIQMAGHQSPNNPIILMVSIQMRQRRTFLCCSPTRQKIMGIITQVINGIDILKFNCIFVFDDYTGSKKSCFILTTLFLLSVQWFGREKQEILNSLFIFSSIILLSILWGAWNCSCDVVDIWASHLLPNSSIC